MATTERGRQEWLALIEAQAVSGLSAAEFCRRKKVPVRKFYRWRQKIRTGPAAQTALQRIKEVQEGDASHLSLLGLGLFEFPAAAGQLQDLESLHLGKNRLSSLADDIEHLQELRRLWLYGNDFQTFPGSLRSLSKLEALYIRDNKLKALPENLGDLGSLEILDLRNNKLQELPRAIGRLRNLRSLLLGQNDLSILPSEIQELRQLERLDLPDNLALGLPPEILSKPPRELLEYYFRTIGASRKLNEAKLLFVGQGSVGKTSLVRRLVDGSFDEKETKTEGIDIREWPIKNLEGELVRLNMWDFGGQEIMHATHQFFLTKRSLYVLVLDARAGESQGNLHYWLEMIRIYGGGSPFLIVLNKCEEHYEALDENRLRLDYDGKIKILGFHYISCKSGQGVSELKQSIIELACSLPHVSDRLPEDYFQVKERLEEQAASADFITEKEYIDVCVKAGVQHRADRMRLLRFLHDLGCVLHYDDPDQIYHVRDTKVLNPEWVTGGVYRVLNDPDLLRAGEGVVQRADLQRLLSSDADSRARYPAHRYPFLVDMMRKYEICFDFPDDPGRLLVPELLSKNEPDVGWTMPHASAGDILDFEYWYVILPRGLMPRFIVRMHHHLTEHPTCWRAGAVLGIEGCRALVRGDTRAARVFVQIQGEGTHARRAALSAVRSCLEGVHRTYGHLKAEAKVRLPLDPDAPSVDYEFLLALEQEGVVDHWFEKARRKYNVRELLNGVDGREYDLFLSHNSNDKQVVRKLRDKLRQHGIRCWLAESDLTPGRPWQQEIAEAIGRCRCVAVLVGPDGFGPWQNLESQLSLDRAANLKGTVIPILLPGSAATPRDAPPELDFLKMVTWVDLRGGVSDEGVAPLVTAIRDY